VSNHQRLWAPLIALLLAAFFLRVLDVDQQSIWYDEGLSIQYARDSLVQMVREVSQSEHPPLYPLLLRLWIRLCGDAELSVRMLSVWWGVLAVALTYRLGRRFTSLLQGLGALLLAVSPFAIWYSQEARGYTQAMALVLAVVNLGVKLLPGRPDPDTPRSAPRYWLYVVYVILATAALYTHIYSALVLLVLNLVYLGQLLHLRWSLLRPKPRAVVLRWIAAQVGVIVLFAPWLPSLLRQLTENATYWHGAVDWEQIIARTFTAYSVGETLSGPWAIGGTLALSLLGLLGIYDPRALALSDSPKSYTPQVRASLPAE
jgi:mannosyltransferase